MNEDAIDPSASRFEIAKCPLPDCNEDLYIIWTGSSALYLSSTIQELATPHPEAGGWEITCEAGHTVMVPIDNAGDDFVFGRCKCEVTDPTPDDFCEHADMDRLRKLLGINGLLSQVSTNAFKLTDEASVRLPKIVGDIDRLCGRCDHSVYSHSTTGSCSFCRSYSGNCK